jgi:hypothetical protein
MAHVTADDEIDVYWEYDNPAASEERFRAALGAANSERDLELQTQIARTFDPSPSYIEA